MENLIDDIYQVFKKDSGFSKSHFKRQVCRCDVARTPCFSVAVVIWFLMCRVRSPARRPFEHALPAGGLVRELKSPIVILQRACVESSAGPSLTINPPNHARIAGERDAGPDSQPGQGAAGTQDSFGAGAGARVRHPEEGPLEAAAVPLSVPDILVVLIASHL